MYVLLIRVCQSEKPSVEILGKTFSFKMRLQEAPFPRMWHPRHFEAPELQMPNMSSMCQMHGSNVNIKPGVSICGNL